MFNFGSNLRDFCESSDSQSNTGQDECLSRSDSLGGDDVGYNLFNCFDCYDSDDSDFSFDDDFDDDGNDLFTYGDTITKALVLWAVKFGVSHTALSALLLILRRFEHDELPKLVRTLLRTPRYS